MTSKLGSAGDSEAHLKTEHNRFRVQMRKSLTVFSDFELRCVIQMRVVPKLYCDLPVAVAFKEKDFFRCLKKQQN